MKKRLLSAALALAMVLTLLPLSAFAANVPVYAAVIAPTAPDGLPSGQFVALNETEHNGLISVAWKAAGADLGTLKNGTKIVAKSDGYYYYNASIETLYYATGGVLANTTNATSGTWYANPIVKNTNFIMSSFTLIGDIAMTGSAYSPSSINVNLNNCSLNLNAQNDAAATANAKLSSLTVTNTPVTGVANRDNSVVTLPGHWAGTTQGAGLSDRSITLNVTNATVTSNGGICVNGAVGNNYGFSGTLTNAKLSGDVYVYGAPNNSSSLRLDMRGDSTASGICATNATLDLDMKAGDTVGGVTCNGKKATIDVNASYSKPATITSITLGNTASENKSGGTINLNSAAHVTGAISTFGHQCEGYLHGGRQYHLLEW